MYQQRVRTRTPSSIPVVPDAGESTSPSSIGYFSASKPPIVSNLLFSIARHAPVTAETSCGTCEAPQIAFFGGLSTGVEMGGVAAQAEDKPGMLEMPRGIEELRAHGADIRLHRPTDETVKPIGPHRFGVVVEKDENPTFGKRCCAVAQSGEIEGPAASRTRTQG